MGRTCRSPEELGTGTGSSLITTSNDRLPISTNTAVGPHPALNTPLTTRPTSLNRIRNTTNTTASSLQPSLTTSMRPPQVDRPPIVPRTFPPSKPPLTHNNPTLRLPHRQSHPAPASTLIVVPTAEEPHHRPRATLRRRPPPGRLMSLSCRRRDRMRGRTRPGPTRASSLPPRPPRRIPSEGSSENARGSESANENVRRPPHPSPGRRPAGRLAMVMPRWITAGRYLNRLQQQPRLEDRSRPSARSLFPR